MDALFSRLTMLGASAMLLTAVVVLWRRHVAAYISAFRWQSVILAGVGALVAWRGDAHELFLISALILGLKGIGVPWILRRMTLRFPAAQELQPLVNTEASLLIAGALSIAAYHIARPLTSVITLPTRGGLPLALALVFVSLFIVVSRRTAVAQIVGFLMLENGIALLALLGAYGVPFIVELGVFLDVLLGVLVMQVLVYQIHETFESIDVQQLDKLRH
jgi:hydrogenase-4 component E